MTSATVRLGQLPQSLLSLLNRVGWGCGCGPTQLLVDRLTAVPSNLAPAPASFERHYTCTIVTDHGNYELDQQSGRTIAAVSPEFLTLSLSKDSTGPQDSVYVRLCSIRAIQEHLDQT
jgi:hypothetical protein